MQAIPKSIPRSGFGGCQDNQAMACLSHQTGACNPKSFGSDPLVDILRLGFLARDDVVGCGRGQEMTFEGNRMKRSCFV